MFHPCEFLTALAEPHPGDAIAAWQAPHLRAPLFSVQDRVGPGLLPLIKHGGEALSTAIEAAERVAARERALTKNVKT